MGCVSVKSSYEMNIDDFYAEMPAFKSFNENYSVINLTLPTKNKIFTLTLEEFETNLNEVLLKSKSESYKIETKQFWNEIFKSHFSGVNSDPLFFLYLSIVCLSKDLNELNFFKALHRFFETIDEPKIKKKDDLLLYAHKDFLHEFLKFYYHLLTSKTIPYVSKYSSNPDDCTRALKIIFEKKKIFLFIKDLLEKLEVIDDYVEMNNFLKLVPLKGSEIRDAIAKRPKVE